MREHRLGQWSARWLTFPAIGAVAVALFLWLGATEAADTSTPTYSVSSDPTVVILQSIPNGGMGGWSPPEFTLYGDGRLVSDEPMASPERSAEIRAERILSFQEMEALVAQVVESGLLSYSHKEDKALSWNPDAVNYLLRIRLDDYRQSPRSSPRTFAKDIYMNNPRGGARRNHAPAKAMMAIRDAFAEHFATENRESGTDEN